MAVAFSAIANGGTIVRPHVAKEIENVDGEPIMDVPGAPRRKLDISKQTLGTVRQGLRRASMEEGGTSYPVFGNFPFDVAGKTGTAERGTTEEGFPLPDQAWFVVMAPADDPEIVVAVTLERGGFGADTAAPIAARMLEQYFDTGPVDPVPVAEGQTHE
jgi:penicillin-binding protein 2